MTYAVYKVMKKIRPESRGQKERISSLCEHSLWLCRSLWLWLSMSLCPTMSLCLSLFFVAVFWLLCPPVSLFVNVDRCGFCCHCHVPSVTPSVFFHYALSLLVLPICHLTCFSFLLIIKSLKTLLVMFEVCPSPHGICWPEPTWV